MAYANPTRDVAADAAGNLYVADGTQPPATTEPDELRTARDNLVETLDRKRSDRRSQMAPLEAGDGASRITDWGQPDSFPVPLDDSRTTLR